MSQCYNSELPIGPPGPPGPQGEQGTQGPAGPASAVTVKDDQGNEVINATEIRFTDPTALVTNLGSGVAEVNFVPPATVWNNVENLAYYGVGAASFRPQYTIEGNKITFRGLLYVPLENGGSPVSVNNGNSYKSIPSVTLDESNLTIVNNANSALGVRQGRFFTPNITTLPNLPSGAVPLSRDITFSNVPAFRRYAAGADSSFRVAIYRTIVTLIIGSDATVWEDGSSNIGAGCILMLAPYQDEYDGGGASPLGNDPAAFLISRVTGGVLGADLVDATDNNPFTVPATDQNNPFSVDAHNVNNLGGFIINLEGLSGYLN
jgi:hypothetical protein